MEKQPDLGGYFGHLFGVSGDDDVEHSFHDGYFCEFSDGLFLLFCLTFEALYA